MDVPHIPRIKVEKNETLFFMFDMSFTGTYPSAVEMVEVLAGDAKEFDDEVAKNIKDSIHTNHEYVRHTYSFDDDCIKCEIIFLMDEHDSEYWARVRSRPQEEIEQFQLYTQLKKRFEPREN
jgi:hypothetical protein